jgi:cytochrome c oxidase cbb3-type subunit 1
MNSVSGQAQAELEREHYAMERARIDGSTRVPVLVFFGFAVFWLLLGTLLALLASIKMHMPEFLADHAWLTFGRVRPAHLNTVAYGWVVDSAFGVMIWLMARLSWAELRYPSLLVAAACIWNSGVLIGTVAILAGQGTSVEWLEFPIYVPPILVVGYALIAVWTFVIFRDRREIHVYVSQWYIIGAMFWLPWLYVTANLLIFWFPVKGVLQASVLWWFGHNTIGLFFSPIALAAVYYLIPKVIGRPVHSYYLSLIGFWSFALFYNWAGTHHLIGGPLPAWLITVGIIGSVMMFIPVGTTALNHHMTMVGHFNKLRYSPTLRFVVFGAIAYTGSSMQGSIEALRDVNRITHFTHYTIGHAHFGLYAFFTMVMFGSMYYIVPRLTGWEWYSANLIRAHFWCTALGITLYVVAMCWGGWFQGVELAHAQPEGPFAFTMRGVLGADGSPVPFLEIVRQTKIYLHLRTVAGFIITAGHLAFATLFVLNLMRYGLPRSGPTLLAKQQEVAAV